MTITETAMDELTDELARLRGAITAATTRLERAFDVWIEQTPRSSQPTN